jgi:hypothetical protein
MTADPGQIQLTNEQRAALALASERAGKPWEEVLSEALRSYRPVGKIGGNGSEPGTFFDAMKDVIGVVKETPADLSTNPEFLRGFGGDCEIGPA